MTRGGLLTCVIATLAASAAAGEVEQAVIAAQDARVAATIAADVAKLGAIVAEDMSYTHSNAVVESRADFLEGLRSGHYDYHAVSFEERRVRSFGDGAAVTGTCLVRVSVGGRAIEVRLRFTELYVKRDGAWKMALWQSTRVPDPTS